MRQWAKHITLLLLLPAFLLFASGVGVVEHSCAACGTVSWTHTQAMDCCGADVACGLDAEEATCCAAPVATGHSHDTNTAIQSDQCCSFERMVLFIDESFVPEPSRLITPFAFFHSSAGAGNLVFSSFLVEVQNLYNAKAPPGKIAGIAFLIFTHQLKIACMG